MVVGASSAFLHPAFVSLKTLICGLILSTFLPFSLLSYLYPRLNKHGLL